jgi:hypothetical protein
VEERNPSPPVFHSSVLLCCSEIRQKNGDRRIRKVGSEGAIEVKMSVCSIWRVYLASHEIAKL